MIYRRCGCRDENRRQYLVLPVTNPTPAQKARACPAMKDPKHGTFSFRISNGYDPRTGKRLRINGATYATRKEAEKALNAARVAKDQGKLTGGAPRLAVYADEFMTRRTTTGETLSITTANNCRRWIRDDIAPSGLGKMRLDRITRRDVRGWVDDMVKAGRGAPTIARVLVVLKAVFSMAIRDELIIANPASRVDPPAVSAAERALWEPDDVLRLLKVAGEHRLGPVYEFMLHSALRRGEVCGLRWSEVDLDRACIQIGTTRVKVDTKTVEKGTKTKDSAGEVELSRGAVEALRVLKLRQDMERDDVGGAWTDTGFVVTMADGRPVDTTYLSKLFDRLVALTIKNRRAEYGAPIREAVQSEHPEWTDTAITSEANRRLDDAGVVLPRVTLHGLRHIALSWAWDRTGDILAVSKLARHASTATTEKVYTHMRTGKVRATAEAISDVLLGVTGHTMDHTTPLAG